MKRIIAAVSLAVLLVPAFAAAPGAPFEQAQLDRGITAQASANGYAASGASGRAASGSVWEKDHNFIAPPQ